MPEFREGPARYFRPVCVRYWLGHIGGPTGYCEVGEEEAESGPIVVDVESEGDQ